MPDVVYAQSLAFLLSQIGAHVAQRFAEAIHESGLSPRAFAVLSNLGEFGPRTQQRLADELGMHRNNMVDLIDEMEVEDLVMRTSDPADRRVHLIEMTPTGKQSVQKALGAIPALDREVAAALPGEAVGELVEWLSLIARSAGLTPGVHPHLAGRRASAPR